MLFSFLILAALCLLQFGLFDGFYYNLKAMDAKRLGGNIMAAYNAQDVALIKDYAYKNNVRITLLDERGNIDMVADGLNSDFNAGALTFPLQEYQMILTAFAQQEEDRLYYWDAENPEDATRIVYVARIPGSISTYYLHINSAVPAVDSTRSVLQMQFFLITIIVFSLSLIVGHLFSEYMARPIIRLKDKANRLAKGDFSVEFSENAYTEVQELSQTLQYATQELSKLEEYRRDLVANVSHDLKTPLTIIRFYGEMIRDMSGENAHKREEHCNMIIREADWLTSMVNELLEMSRLQANAVPMAQDNVNFSACLQETLSEFQALSEKKGYVFRADVEPDCLVTGDEKYLKRMMYNLISNAVNYTGEDKTVHIMLHRQDKQIRFAVTDSGPGIAPEEIDSIWEKYYKSSESHRRLVIGSGLGLSIVKMILSSHQAQYGVDSEIGQGSTFWVLLPQAETRLPQDEKTENSKQGQRTAPVRPKDQSCK